MDINSVIKELLVDMALFKESENVWFKNHFHEIRMKEGL